MCDQCVFIFYLFNEFIENYFYPSFIFQTYSRPCREFRNLKGLGSSPGEFRRTIREEQDRVKFSFSHDFSFISSNITNKLRMYAFLQVIKILSFF